jgi:hypothetical protein
MSIIKAIFVVFLILLFHNLFKKEEFCTNDSNINLFSDDKFSLLQSPRATKDKIQYYRTFSGYPEYLQDADVVVLGNSRPLLGLHPNNIKMLESQDKLKLYNLSFGFSDNVNFGKYLIDESGSFPKYVAVHVGPYIFSKFFSIQAFDALSKGKWTNYLDYMDFILSSRLQLNLNNHLGNSLLVNNNHYYYRSVKSGCVHIFGDLSEKKFSYKSMNTSFSPDRLKDTADFVDWAKERSIQPILFQVPAPRLDPSHVPMLAKRFELPYIVPLLGIYSTFDNSHLTPKSAEIFTDYFIAELKNLIQ